MTRLDWDREARHARLRSWLQSNPRADFVECPPPPQELDRIDLWARRQVDLCARRVRAQAREDKKAADSTTAHIADRLEAVSAALDRDDASATRSAAAALLNDVAMTPLGTLEASQRRQVFDVLALALVYAE